MRILVSTHFFPWPPSSGTGIRTVNVIGALAQLGEVDVVAMVAAGSDRGLAVPPDAPVRRTLVVRRPGASSRVRRALGAATGALPTQLARDYSGARSEVARWLDGPYDLAWLAKAEGFRAFAGLTSAPTISDLDDVEHLKLAGRLGADRAVGTGGPGALERLRISLDIRLWRRFEQHLAHRVETVIVCSELDRVRLGAGNAEVLANVYPEPAAPAGRPAPGDPPTLLFVGQLTYGPNVDAARFLVTEVFPSVRERKPEVRLRLVGEHDGRLADLAGAEGVTMTGRVADIEDELAGADVVVVPIRFGGGTRVKILEAFAHRIPVVATTVGAEGLAVTSGRHLLLADSPGELAAACLAALDDAALRERLRGAAHGLWAEHHRPESMARRIPDLVAGAVERRALRSRA